MRYVLTLLQFLLLFFFYPALSNAQSVDRSIDSIISRVFPDDDGPGGVFLVARQGRPVFLKAYGKANLELKVDMTTDNVFQLGSMTKQFTAIAILLLEEAGKLKVTDPLATYLPDFPNGKNITLHHLLTHTSGIKDFTRMKSLGSIASKEMTPCELVDFFKNEPVDFAPGEQFDYNNSGYVLLGYVIELVSGESYAGFMEKHIFQPLGMIHSRYASDRDIVFKRAYGYQLKNEGWVNKTAISFSIPYASGAIMSTVEDLLTWQNALDNHLLLPAIASRKAFENYTLHNGKNIQYGYGWHIKNNEGTQTREHGGSIFGFKSMAIYMPDSKTYVVGLSNGDGRSPTQVVRDIAGWIVRSKW